MALSEPLGNFFSIGVPSGLLCCKIGVSFKNDIRDVCSIADFIDSRLSNFDFSNCNEIDNCSAVMIGNVDDHQKTVIVMKFLD